MCDIETLRLFVNERLSAVAEDILAVFVRTIVQYQQQIDETHRHGVTSDLADVLHPLGYKEEVSPEHQQMSSSPIQEEPESPPHIKEEHKEIFQRPERADVLTMTLLPVKSEHNDRETEPLASTSTEHMKTQADVEYCGTSQPTSDVQLLSSESDTEDSDEWEQTREDQPALNAVKSHKTHTVGGQRSSLSNKVVSQEPTASSTEKNPFSCTVCGKRFNQPGNLKMHMRIHRVSGQDQGSDSSSPWGQTASWQSGPQEVGLGPPSIPNTLIPGSPASAAMMWRIQEVDAGSPSSQPSGMPTTPQPQVAIPTHPPSSAEGHAHYMESVGIADQSIAANPLQTLQFHSSFAIRQILEATYEGRSIVQSLDGERSITTKQRKQLVRLLVSHLLDNIGQTPPSETKKALALALVCEFPCLMDDTGTGYGAWYTASGKRKPATGFLEERLRNARKRLRNRKRQEQQTAQSLSTTSGNGSFTPALYQATTESSLAPARFQEMVDWLKVHKRPVSQVEAYMKETAVYRGKWIRSDGSKSLPQILNEFPRLVDDPVMISQDFQQLHPKAVGRLLENWPSMSDRILAFAQREGKLPVVLDDVTPDRALKVLPTLLPPPIYKSEGKIFRPTMEESRRSFIDIQPVGTNMAEYLQRAATAQPFPHVLCLGDEVATRQAFTVVSDKAIEADTLLGAVDLCFKAFFVLDIKYPKQCLPTWEFIQHTVYQIDGHESSNVKFLRASIFSAHA